MKILFSFFADGIREIFRGNGLYWGWMGGLTVLVVIGARSYLQQLDQGLIVTGLSDQISWGAYIANFTYLVGVAAAAVMLVIPAYIFHRQDMKTVVLIGEGIAVAAATMSILFVVVDLGRPDRIWHMIPFLGNFHFPQSLLAWDVLVLSGYLFLNLAIPFYILFTRYRGREPSMALYFPAVLISIVWAISIHTVTAFLFSSNIARPFWHTAVLGPRFLASAFSSGPALIILALQCIDWLTPFKVDQRIIDTLAVITTVALQISLFLLGVELFTEFYAPTEHNISAQFLFFGLPGNVTLVPWIWTSIGFNVVAVVMLSIHTFRHRRGMLNAALMLLIVGVWIDKGMGLIVPGFVPTPIGEVFEYIPTGNEILLSVGIYALGLMIFTILAKIAIPIELGVLSYQAGQPSHTVSGMAPGSGGAS